MWKLHQGSPQHQATFRTRKGSRFAALRSEHLNTFSTAKRSPLRSCCVTIVIAVLFGAAAFATNGRLLYALRAQKEATAATMVLQQRMESLRAISFTNVATKDFLANNIFNAATGSATPLGELKRTGRGRRLWRHQRHPDHTLAKCPASKQSAGLLSTNDTLANTSTTCFQVDLLLQWTSENGRHAHAPALAVFRRRKHPVSENAYCPTDFSRAFTLVEMLMTLASSSIVMAAVIVGGVALQRSFAAMEGYSIAWRVISCGVSDYIAMDCRRALSAICRHVRC